MKTIDLNIKYDTFYLGELKYTYKVEEEDKDFYKNSILSLNPKEDDIIKNLIEIFEIILKKQNYLVFITENDVVGLLHYFNSKLL